MVDKVASTVITRGPHKLAPISADGPPPPGSVAPPERALAATEGALNGRPDTPPDTEPDDAAASDVDSGTADVMDDLPSPVTPEPEELAADRVKEEDRHRVVISVTQNSSEVSGRAVLTASKFKCTLTYFTLKLHLLIGMERTLAT